MNRLSWLGVLALTFALLAGAACSGGGDDAPPTPTPRPQLTEAEARPLLQAMILQPADIGSDYTGSGSFQTNEDAAAARPDADNARQQIRDWQQVLTYRVQYNAPANADLLFNAKTAQVMNTATLYNSSDGASQSLAFLQSLTEDAVAQFLSAGGGDTKLTETKVKKDVEFPAKGDESFLWRVSGKATLASGLTVNYVADAVFVRFGRVTGNVTTIALGQPPDHTELEKLVDLFLSRTQAGG